MTNPEMGWVFYDNLIPGNELDYSPGATGAGSANFWAGKMGDKVRNIAVMCSWDLIETSPGIYDWSKYDQAIAYWKAKGKDIQLRFATDALLFMDHTAGVPQWVIDGDPKTTSDDMRITVRENVMGTGKTVVFPDYTLERYKRELQKFLTAFAGHYKDDPAIKSVDLRGYGLWGEWHSGADYETLEQRRTALMSIIGIWYEAWGGKKTLAISVSPETSLVKPEFDPNSDLYTFMEFTALDHALTKPNITIRRDGVGFPIKLLDGSILRQFWEADRRLPIILEHAFGYRDHLPGGKWGERTPDQVMEEANMYHGTYISVFGHDRNGSLPFFTGRPDLVDKANRDNR